MNSIFPFVKDKIIANKLTATKSSTSKKGFKVNKLFLKEQKHLIILQKEKANKYSMETIRKIFLFFHVQWGKQITSWRKKVPKATCCRVCNKLEGSLWSHEDNVVASLDSNATAFPTEGMLQTFLSEPTMNFIFPTFVFLMKWNQYENLITILECSRTS